MKCPEHGRRLYGGPVQFWCNHGDGHRVMAADVDHEFDPSHSQAAA